LPSNKKVFPPTPQQTAATNCVHTACFQTERAKKPM
jgi:hypothetical protein